ncbi:glutamate-rich protein 5 isoform X2 [Engystomops pustulosus]|uniref:glutamate-rich protein 5 isoform X2 n=1 Tax=Engystomops pustulosus TaxID=76066 RepID=UPI003AFABE6B
MGCSSSTLTHPQGGNRPPAKSLETNGPKKSENEASTNGIPPEDEQTEAVEAVELDQEEPTEPPTEDCCSSDPPGEEEPVEESTDLITVQDSSVVEGEIEEAVEAKMHEESVSEGPETIEDESGHPVDEAEPEMETADVEE